MRAQKTACRTYCGFKYTYTTILITILHTRRTVAVSKRSRGQSTIEEDNHTPVTVAQHSSARISQWAILPPPPPPPGRCLPEISDRSCSVSSACRANVARNNCPMHASHELQLPLGMGRCTQWYCIGQVLGPRILPGFVEARRSTAEDAVSQPPGSGMVLGFTSIRRNTTQGARQLCMRMSRMVGVHNDGNPDRPNSPQETMVSVSGGASLRTPMHALRC